MKYRSKLYEELPVITLQFMAGIELGVPSKNCKNFGICRITPVGNLNGVSQEPCNCTHQCKGVVTVLENEEIEICFLRKSISEADFEKYFASETFLVEEDFSFDSKNGLASQFKILKGRYPISLGASLVKVTFGSERKYQLG